VRLIDSHCHLQADPFDDDLELVIDGARLAGVERILVPGWDAPSSTRAVELIDRFPWLDAAAGIHPHAAAAADDTDWRRIVALSAHPRVRAIGETGLDYDRMFSPVLAQLTNLRRHLRLAAETGKPAILHCRSIGGEREAQDALLAEIRAFGSEPPPILIHSYSGPVDYALSMLELGAAVSFSGLVFRDDEEASADAVRLIPSEDLLVETDSPYLPPPGAPRRRNAPEWVAVTAAWAVEQRHEDPDAFGEALIRAYDRVFRGIPVHEAPAGQPVPTEVPRASPHRPDEGGP
jgi:TatD DNase family protein